MGPGFSQAEATLASLKGKGEALYFVEAVETADRSRTAVDKISGPHP